MSEELSYPNLYLCGKAGSGKSTVANMLVSEFGYRRAALADGVKLGVAAILESSGGMFRNYIKDLFGFEDDVEKALHAYDECGVDWQMKLAHGKHWQTGKIPKKHYREFMTWWGTEVCRNINKNVWINYYLRHTFDFESPLVCDDVRFYNEEYTFSKKCYTGIHIIRASHDNGMTEMQATHESEQYEPEYCKYTINNDGDLAQLNSRLHEIMEAITNE